ncbi:MAG: hypothetical protein ACR2FV_02125 [Ornithinimicrobium sp.]|uniref:hypothetical protein n=1 Tax=Ornithinimicrobium sp. TaxID=1977084 RepID=UPI003D9B914A
MNRRLQLTGWVTDEGEPLGAALPCSRSSGTPGDYAGTTAPDPDGHYELGLPPPGRYVLTVIETATGRTRSRAVQIGAVSATLDIDLSTGIPRQRSAATR